MASSWDALLFICASFALAGCGAGSKRTASSQRDATGVGTVAGASPSANMAASPRQKMTARVLKAFSESSTDEERARAAAEAFAEQDYGVPSGLARALGAVAGTKVDPRDCSRVIWEGLQSAATPLVEKVCGSFETLKTHVQAKGPLMGAKGERAAMVSAVIETCKVAGVPVGDVSQLDPWGVLASAVTSDMLAHDPQSNDDEKKLAHQLIYLCSIPPAR